MASFPKILIRLLIVQGILLFVLAHETKSVRSTAGADWYYENWCGGSLEYLDDGKCAKIFPAAVADRDWMCTVPTTDVPSDAGFQADTLLSNVKVDTTELASVVNDTDVNLCVILTQRVVNESAPTGVTLYNKYLCAGDYSATVAYETWSSSKVFAMANAAGHLRTNESTCGDGNIKNHQYGLDGRVTGKHGLTELGDLATVICSYDETAGYSSNSLSSYFHDIGWRDRINGLVQNWLLKEDNLTPSNQQRLRSDLPQTLGGNYGEATPSDLTLTVTPSTPVSVLDSDRVGSDRTKRQDTAAAVSNLKDDQMCEADKDPWLTVYSNSLSALSAAELVRRLALHRELPESLRFPGTSWRDVQTILYGAAESVFFPGQVWGGMTADTAIFTQAALDLPSLLQTWNAQDTGQWRIFSKLGAGYSSGRNRGEIVSNAYACLPRYDSGSDGKVIGGLEFTIAARSSVPYDASLQKTEQHLHSAMDSALQYVLATYA